VFIYLVSLTPILQSLSLTKTDAEAPRAARLLGISFANALTGWKFHGRHGTAILTGGVVASEYREAVEAVIEGFEDERVQAEEKRRSEAALNMWLRFARIFRIKQYLDETHGVVGEDTDGHDVDDEKADLQIGARDGDEGEDKSEEGDEGMESEEYDDDDMAGGFFPE
jgi:xeroderma pigmentosum group C-complementing protein